MASCNSRLDKPIILQRRTCEVIFHGAGPVERRHSELDARGRLAARRLIKSRNEKR